MATVGPLKELPCKFPFIYKREQHDGCVKGTKGTWCPTSFEPYNNSSKQIINVDYLDLDSETYNNNNGGKWGYCGANCPRSSQRDKNKMRNRGKTKNGGEYSVTWK